MGTVHMVPRYIGFKREMDGPKPDVDEFFTALQAVWDASDNNEKVNDDSSSTKAMRVQAMEDYIDACGKANLVIDKLRVYYGSNVLLDTKHGIVDLSRNISGDPFRGRPIKVED